MRKTEAAAAASDVAAVSSRSPSVSQLGTAALVEAAIADPPATTTDQGLKKHSCVLCAQRKVKCDRKDPCSACVKADAQCIFTAPPTTRRYRKRYAEENVFARLKRYEELLKSNGIDLSASATEKGSRLDQDLKKPSFSAPAPPKESSHPNLLGKDSKRER